MTARDNHQTQPTPDRATWLGEHWPLLASLAILLVWVGLTATYSMRQTDGLLVYSLDDTYIHMALSKNLALYGVWGVTPYEWSSTSSSPLWTLLLAGTYLVFGVRDWLPLALNLLAAAGVLVAAHRMMRRVELARGYAFVFLLLLVAVLPLPTLILLGMEHTLHVLVTLLVFDRATRLFVPEGRVKWLGRDSLIMLGLVVLLVMARFESLLLAGVLFGMFFVTRRPTYGALVMAVAALPVAVYAAISVTHGGMLLPNSVHIKGTATIAAAGGWAGVLAPRFIVGMLAGEWPVAALMIGLLVMGLLRFRSDTRLREADVFGMALAFTASLVHLLLLSRHHLGWDTRYKAYIVGMLIVGLAYLTRRVLPPAIQWTVLRQNAGLVATGVALGLVFMGVPLWDYAVYNQQFTAHAPRDIYVQQIHMARFLDRYYTGSVVAANDIGAITYYATIRLIDVAALGNNELTRGLVTGTTDWETYLNGLASTTDLEIALVYPHRILDMVPTGWVEAGTWHYAQASVVNPDVVFYGASEERARILRERLIAFQPELPDEITLILPESGE